MNLLEAMKNVDKSEPDSWVNIEAIAYALYLSDYKWDCPNLKGYWLEKWRCTDTTVGRQVLYLNDELVGLLQQNTRKGHVTIKFISTEAANKVREYIIDERNDFDIIDFNEEINDTYSLEFACQLLHEHKVGVYNERSVTHIPSKKKYGYDYTDQKIQVRDPDGKVLKIDIHDFKIPINVVHE